MSVCVRHVLHGFRWSLDEDAPLHEVAIVSELDRKALHWFLLKLCWRQSVSNEPPAREVLTLVRVREELGGGHGGCTQANRNNKRHFEDGKSESKRRSAPVYYGGTEGVCRSVPTPLRPPRW